MAILAYLDPGSGSALVGTIIAVAGAALYSLKSFFYRLVRGKASEEDSGVPDIAIFSEGKNYWGTFREIVDELISRKVRFAYYTMDLHDPALLIDSPYMHSRLFDARKATSFRKMEGITAKVLLSTTPNIGTPGYPLARPKGVKTLVHVFHAFADISAYHIGSLDAYDVVLSVGPHQERPIREVESARHLAAKRIVPAGLPYFDAQLHDVENSANSAAAMSSRTVLVAPSWGEKGLLAEYGTDFIRDLAAAGFRVIVRPHPQSYITEPEFIERCKAATADCPEVKWDEETVGSKAMAESALLISDTSSIRFDYAFLYGRPVITFDIPREKQTAYEGQFMSEIWTDAAARRIGRVIGHDGVGAMVDIVREVLSGGAAEGVLKFRDETITNLGSSARAIADFLVSEAKGNV